MTLVHFYRQVRHVAEVLAVLQSTVRRLTQVLGDGIPHHLRTRPSDDG